MVSFADLSQRLHLINDLILSDMICVLDMNESDTEAMLFSKHVLTTKHWFGRISYPNKKRYLLALLHDVRSAWTLSLLLKSIWNCRPKDAIMSVSLPGQWLSSYDQAPMDHNRTAMPVTTLKQTMKNDRVWFLGLEPEAQALLLSELLTVAGGPAMWELLRRAQTLFNNYSNQLMQNIYECIPVSQDGKGENKAGKKGSVMDSTATHPPPQQPPQALTQGQKDVEANLTMWNATIKSLRDSLKLEELETTFLDGTTRKIWKVNRPKPDVLETVDFLQLLPSAIGKRIISYLPPTSFGEYARVNKYWAYLIDEYRAEIVVRTKIDLELAKLKENIMKHDEDFDDLDMTTDLILPATSEHGAMTSTGALLGPHNMFMRTAPSVRASEKSGGGYSLRYFSEKLAKPAVAQKPIRNMIELNERLDIRGAIDENIWKWCSNITAHHRKISAQMQSVIIEKNKVRFLQRKDVKEKKQDELDDLKKGNKTGIIDSSLLDNLHFPCPLMKRSLVVPLKPPLYKDPAKTTPALKPKRKMSDAWLPGLPDQRTKHYSLWTRDVSPLYPVFKIPSHQFPP